MSVTLKNIRTAHPSALAHEQVDSMQLFIITYNSYKYLVSYYTIVGFKLDNDPYWCLSAEGYNRTTTRQYNKFTKRYPSVRIGMAAFNRALLEVSG